MIQVDEIPDTNFVNFTNGRVSEHSVTVTDTIDSSYIVLALDETEQNDISFMR
jgi:hypothetical protein